MSAKLSLGERNIPIEENFIFGKCLVKIHLNRDAKNGQFLKKIEKNGKNILLISTYFYMKLTLLWLRSKPRHLGTCCPLSNATFGHYYVAS
jgi:hypothetical protein